MTLDDLRQEFDIDFHDAHILAYSFDLTTRLLTMDLKFWMLNDPSSEDGGGETLRIARLELRGVAYFVIDPPDPSYGYADEGSVMIDHGDGVGSSGLPPTRPGDFAARFYVFDWNSHISFSANDAGLRWLETWGT